MKKKFAFWGGVAAAVLLVATATWEASRNSINDTVDDITLANVQALAYDFNGQSWDTDEHWYNSIGSNWYPSMNTCTTTTTHTVTVSYTTNGVTASYTYSTSTSRDGKQVSCSGGSGNCFNGTGCI